MVSPGEFATSLKASDCSVDILKQSVYVKQIKYYLEITQNLSVIVQQLVRYAQKFLLILLCHFSPNAN